MRVGSKRDLSLAHKEGTMNNTDINENLALAIAQSASSSTTYHQQHGRILSSLLLDVDLWSRRCSTTPQPKILEKRMGYHHVLDIAAYCQTTLSLHYRTFCSVEQAYFES